MYGNRTILPTDNIFVTLLQNGKNVFNLCQSNFTNMTEIVKMVYGLAKNCAGVAILGVRNQNQGWSCSIPLMFFAPKSTKPTGSKISQNRKPRQSELPFVWQ